jgi:hypothetical protein
MEQYMEVASTWQSLRFPPAPASERLELVERLAAGVAPVDGLARRAAELALQRGVA